MNRSDRNTRSRTWLTLGASSVALGAFIGCGGSGQDSVPNSGFASRYANLTTDLSVCQQSMADCLDVLDGNISRRQTCHDELASCRDAVRAARQEVHEGLRACVDQARQCANSVSADAGREAYTACKEQFHGCVQEALPPPPPVPPCVQELRTCFENAGDGGGEARMACKDQFHACAIANLPPCMQGFASCLDGGGDFRTCLSDKRGCMQYRATHDGGVPAP